MSDCDLVYFYIHYRKLEEQTFDIQFFSLVRTLDILDIARWNRCSCLDKNHVLWLVEVSPDNPQIAGILTRLKNLTSKVVL